MVGLEFGCSEEKSGHEGVRPGLLRVPDDVSEGLGMAAGTEMVEGGCVEGEIGEGGGILGHMAVAASES